MVKSQLCKSNIVNVHWLGVGYCSSFSIFWLEVQNDYQWWNTVDPEASTRGMFFFFSKQEQNEITQAFSPIQHHLCTKSNIVITMRETSGGQLHSLSNFKQPPSDNVEKFNPTWTWSSGIKICILSKSSSAIVANYSHDTTISDALVTCKRNPSSIPISTETQRFQD